MPRPEEWATIADIPVNRIGRAFGLIGRAAGQILGDGLRVDGPTTALLKLAEGLSDDDLSRVNHSSDELVALVRRLQRMQEAQIQGARENAAMRTRDNRRAA